MHFKFALFLLPILLFAEVGYVEPWGPDNSLVKRLSQEAPMPSPRRNLAARIAEKIILFHQNILSPADGPRSNFRPTSSRYMLLAIRRHGFIHGFLMGCDRLMRENKDPWVYRKRVINGAEYKWDPTY